MTKGRERKLPQMERPTPKEVFSATTSHSNLEKVKNKKGKGREGDKGGGEAVSIKDLAQRSHQPSQLFTKRKKERERVGR